MQELAAKKYNELISKCDQCIKEGNIAVVIELVSKLNISQVPREFRQSLAKICRRVDMVNHGLRMLQPLVRNEQSSLDLATPGEISEYSVLLTRNGSIREAILLLEEIDPVSTPEATLYLAYCHISNWDYQRAAPLLEIFLASTADEYSKLIARVNLAAAYLANSQIDQAANLLAVIIPLAEKAGASRLIGNTLELRARLHLQAGNFTESRADLERSLKIFSSSPSYDRLFIDKWLAIMTAIETRSPESLVAFRQQAANKKEWESVREIDLYRTKICFDQAILDFLIYGTPMNAFRERVYKDIGASPSSQFTFGQTGSQYIDLVSGKMDRDGLNPGKKIHHVLLALVKDFYAPRNIGTLFADLYPNEYFDVNSSANRVKQVLLRTRNWLKENRVPASIVQENGQYQFVIHGAFGVSVPFESEELGSVKVRWNQLVALPNLGPHFTARQACDLMKWPRSTFLAVAAWAMQSGALKKSGEGKATIYEIQSADLSLLSRRAA